MRNRRPDAGHILNVKHHHVGTAPIGFDLGAQFFEPIDPPRSQNYAGTSLRQDACKARTQTT
jgi:hypothetical protein